MKVTYPEIPRPSLGDILGVPPGFGFGTTPAPGVKPVEVHCEERTNKA